MTDAPVFPSALKTRLWRVPDGWKQIALKAAFVAGLTLYAAAGSVAAVLAPPVALFFLAPLLVAIAALIPRGRALPRRWMRRGIYAAAFLLTLWPVYLHVKLGPLPILTPPRLILYALTVLWLLDLLRAPLRRAQLALAVRRAPRLCGLVFAFFALGALSLPLASGRAIAAPEFFRQLIIFLLPFCVALTYFRRAGDLLTLMKVIAAGAAVSGLIALMEAGTGRLMADVLSPLVSDNAEWLRIAQAQKIRDGVFRAQASHTHPLSLGEFLAFLAPFGLALFLAARRLPGKLWWGGAFALILGGAFATSSRGAILAILVSMAAMGLILAARFFRRPTSLPFRPLAGLACLMLVGASPLVYAGVETYVSGTEGQSTGNSSQARLDQMELAWPKIIERPVGGYGVGRAARVLGYWGQALTIDNYYLTLALDLGLPGPVVFAGMLAAAGGAGLVRSRHGPKSHQLLYAAFAAGLAGFLVCRTILSLSGNLALLYLILGAFAGAGVAASRPAGRQRIADRRDARDTAVW